MVSLNNHVSRILFSNRDWSDDHLSSSIFSHGVMRANILLHLVGVCQATTSLRHWCALTPCVKQASTLIRVSAPFHPYTTKKIGRAVPYPIPYNEIELLSRGLFCCSPTVVTSDGKINICLHYPVQQLFVFEIREKALPHTDPRAHQKTNLV